MYWATDLNTICAREQLANNAAEYAVRNNVIFLYSRHVLWKQVITVVQQYLYG